MLASNRLSRPEPNLIYRIPDSASAGKLMPIRPADTAVTSATAMMRNDAKSGDESKVLSAAGWHVSGEVIPAATSSSLSPPSVDPFPTSTQVAHPQPMERPRQTVLR
jgi:hypothetical protein